MLSNSTTRTAVVVGSTGIVGRAIAAKLAELGGWRVVGVTRSGGTVPGVDEAIRATSASAFAATPEPKSPERTLDATGRQMQRPVRPLMRTVRGQARVGRRPRRLARRQNR